MPKYTEIFAYLLTLSQIYGILWYIVNDRGAAYKEYVVSETHLPQMSGNDGKGWLPKTVRRMAALVLRIRSAGLSNGLFGVLSEILGLSA